MSEGGGIVGGLLPAAIGSVARLFRRDDEPSRAVVVAQPDYSAFYAGATPPVGAARRGVVMRAATTGAPAGTGAGVGQPQPPPSAPGAVQYVQFIVELLNYLRSLGIRLPWDPKPPRLYGGGAITLNLGGDPVPYFLPPSFSGGGDALGVGLAGLGSGIGSIISAIRGPAAMPGGLSFLPGAGAIARGVGTLATGYGIGQGIEALFGGGGCPVPSSPFGAARSTVRAQTFVVQHPETGRAVWFRPAGRPMLWSGDFAAVRRVRKIAGKARRRAGGR